VTVTVTVTLANICFVSLQLSTELTMCHCCGEAVNATQINPRW